MVGFGRFEGKCFLKGGMKTLLSVDASSMDLFN